jgi:hypothetical protein
MSRRQVIAKFPWKLLDVDTLATAHSIEVERELLLPTKKPLV